MRKRKDKRKRGRIAFFGQQVKFSELRFSDITEKRTDRGWSLFYIPSGFGGELARFRTKEELKSWIRKLDLLEKELGGQFQGHSDEVIQNAIEIVRLKTLNPTSNSGETGPQQSISSPAPQEYIDPSRPISDKYGIAVWDYE